MDRNGSFDINFVFSFLSAALMIAFIMETYGLTYRYISVVFFFLSTEVLLTKVSDSCSLVLIYLSSSHIPPFFSVYHQLHFFICGRLVGVNKAKKKGRILLQGGL